MPLMEHFVVFFSSETTQGSKAVQAASEDDAEDLIRRLYPNARVCAMSASMVTEANRQYLLADWARFSTN